MDDGVESRREFEIESQIMGRAYQFTIPATSFSRMDWPLEQMGPAAITFPNQKEYARTAIQSFSLTAEERQVQPILVGATSTGIGCTYMQAVQSVRPASSII
jgi:hypothetical protein